MKLDFKGPVRDTAHQGYIVPTFGGDDQGPMASELQSRLKRPMVLGAIFIGVFVVGLGAWASIDKLATGITGTGEVRTDAMRKTLRHRESGIVKQILVKEGQAVRAGQPLLLFNDVEARAAVDVLQNQYDTMVTQSARFTAEATGASALKFPADVMARAADPGVSQMVRDQQFLFTARQQLYTSQTAILGQRIEQQQTQVQGMQAQLDSVVERQRLTQEELDGYRKLNEQGFAPKTLVLRYQASMADLAGRRGQIVSEIARLGQQIGETRLQLSQIRNERQSQAAEGLRESQTRLADVTPRLTAARQSLDATVVRSPVDGNIFNLTQFTLGGLVGAGEVIMDVVPTGAPLTVTAMIRPEDVDEVRVGMPARVQLTGLNQRFNQAMDAKVSVVTADRMTNQQSGLSFYRVDVRIDPSQLSKLKKGVQMTSGMPATVTVVGGKRSVMGYLISPITSTWEDAFRQE